MARDWDKENSPTAQAYASVNQVSINEAKLQKQVELEDEIHTVDLVITELQVKLTKLRACAVNYEDMSSRHYLMEQMNDVECAAQSHLIGLKRKLKGLG